MVVALKFVFGVVLMLFGAVVSMFLPTYVMSAFPGWRSWWVKTALVVLVFAGCVVCVSVGMWLLGGLELFSVSGGA